MRRERLERGDQRVALGDQAQRGGELHHVPMDRLGLAAEGVEAGVIEIGRREGGVPRRGEPPWAIIEAFARHVDIVAVEHAMNRSCRHIARGEPRGALDDMGEQADGIVGLLGVQIVEDVTDERAHARFVAFVGEALEAADADMAVAEAHQHRRPRGEGSSPRTSSSPVSISDSVRLVGTFSASSISVARISRTPPFSVSRPSPKRL